MNFEIPEAIIKSPNELHRILSYYREYIGEEATNYIASLINMEFSVFSDHKVSRYDRKLVAGLMIFRETAIYNITQTLIPLFSNEDYTISNLYRQFTISRIIDRKYFEILKFLYNVETKDDDFGIVTITKYHEYKECELQRIEDEIARLKDKHEKYRGFSSMYENLSYNSKLKELRDEQEKMSIIPNDVNKKDKINLLNSVTSIICQELCTSLSDDDASIVTLKKTPGIRIEQSNQKV